MNQKLFRQFMELFLSLFHQFSTQNVSNRTDKKLYLSPPLIKISTLDFGSLRYYILSFYIVKYFLHCIISIWL